LEMTGYFRSFKTTVEGGVMREISDMVAVLPCCYCLKLLQEGCCRCC
jgi:hypothetical protein